MSDVTRRKSVALALVTAAVVLVPLGLGLWLRDRGQSGSLQIASRPDAGQGHLYIMSTQMTMKVVLPAKKIDQAGEIFTAAEAAARIVESRMNVYNPRSELSRFNAAPPGEKVPLTADTMRVLHRAKRLHAASETAGAFDVTVRPLLMLWKRAGKENTLPTKAAIQRARAESKWADITLFDKAAEKAVAGAKVDLGGIAKGYAIDLAIEAMQACGASGGMVDIGGDVRCFGVKPGDKPWLVGVNDPFNPNGKRLFASLRVRNGSVCTSGNYERFSIIGAQRFSHIVDPRTGWPVDACPSVTVIAPDATTADAWATALSVLGEKGLALLAGKGIEAMIITGTPEKHHWAATPGFRKHFAQEPASPAK